MKRISLLSLALLSLAGVWAQSGTPDPISVADVQITHEEFAVFKSHDTIMYNPQTGQYDSITVDDGMEIMTPQEFEAMRAAKSEAVRKIMVREQKRMQNPNYAPSVTPDADWQYEGKHNRSSAHLYYFTYPSIDADGNPVRLSALMGVPTNTVFDDLADILTAYYTYVPWGHWVVPTIMAKPSNVVIGCHVTVTSNWEAPTSYNRYFSILGLANFQTDAGMMLFYTRYDLLRQPCCLVIMPDYEGYGATVNRPHPYLYQELTARQCVDATRYGLALYNSKVQAGDVKKLVDNWKTVSVGFSQGGSVSLAVHKYIETNGLDDELHFAGSVCGDGPYSPIATLKYYMTDEGNAYDGDKKTTHDKECVSMPVALALIVKGMLDSNPYMRQYKLTDFFKQNFLNTGIIDYIEAKSKPNKSDQYTTVQVTAAFRKIKKEGKHNGITIHDVDKLFPKYVDKNLHGNLAYMLTDECLEDFRRLAKGESLKNKFMRDMVKALESNNTSIGWKPKKRIALYHSTYDTVVPYENMLEFMRNQKDLSYFFDDDKSPAKSLGVPTADKEHADVFIMDRNSKSDHVPAGTDFFLFGAVTSPDYSLMKWVLEGKK